MGMEIRPETAGWKHTWTFVSLSGGDKANGKSHLEEEKEDEKEP